MRELPLPFRDDFNGSLQPGWILEEPDRGGGSETRSWRFEEQGWLLIEGGRQEPGKQDDQVNTLWTELPSGAVEITVHLSSHPLSDSQRAGLLLYPEKHQGLRPEAGDFIFLSEGYCLGCVLGGSGVFLEYQLGAERGRYVHRSAEDDLYLKLILEEGLVSAYFAFEEGAWQHLASLSSPLQFHQAGLSIRGDPLQQAAPLRGRFDYFEIRRPASMTPTATPAPFPQAKDLSKNW
jgi:hypothetical protein